MVFQANIHTLFIYIGSTSRSFLEAENCFHNLARQSSHHSSIHLTFSLKKIEHANQDANDSSTLPFFFENEIISFYTFVKNERYLFRYVIAKFDSLHLFSHNWDLFSDNRNASPLLNPHTWELEVKNDI